MAFEQFSWAFRGFLKDSKGILRFFHQFTRGFKRLFLGGQKLFWALNG